MAVKPFQLDYPDDFGGRVQKALAQRLTTRAIDNLVALEGREMSKAASKVFALATLKSAASQVLRQHEERRSAFASFGKGAGASDIAKSKPKTHAAKRVSTTGSAA
jgi:hypothetical protein